LLQPRFIVALVGVGATVVEFEDPFGDVAQNWCFSRFGTRP
jgi:hypothetical protein